MKTKTKLKINTALFTVIVIACVVAVNAIVYVVSQKKPMKLDLTREKIYEFSDETKDLVSGLQKDVKIYSLMPNGSSGEYISYINEYLDKYKSLSGRLTVEYVDPDENPTFMNKYKSEGESINTYDLIVTCGDKYKIVPSSGFFRQSQNGGDVSIDLEKKVTTAIMAVVGSGDMQKAYFVEGHGELNRGNLKSLLTDDGYECEEINIGVSGIPDDCALLVMLSPVEDFTAEEIERLDKYFDNAGQAMMVFAVGVEVPEKLSSYLTEWGIAVNNDYVVETDKSRVYATQSGMMIPTPEMDEHDITSKLMSRDLVYMAPYCRSIGFDSANAYNATSAPLLETSEDSYAVDASTLEQSDSDAKGPLCVTRLFEKQAGDGKARIFVSGSIDAVENAAFTNGTYANGDFIRNAAAYMTEKTDTLSIRAKTISADSMEMSQLQIICTGILIVLLLPIIILVYGLVVWARRRHL